MRILIVGGSGFIGTHLAPALLQAGHTLRIFDRIARASANVEAISGDILNSAEIIEAARGADIIYHLAAEHRDDVRPVRRYYEVNVGGAKSVVRAAAECNVGKIVFTSTVAVYGLNAGETDERSPAKPFNHYGKSKLEAEQVFRRWSAANGHRSLVIVRPTVVFGQGSKGNVQTLIDQINANRFVMVGNGQNKKSMCYVRNLVHFLVEALSLDGRTNVVNYADKPDLTVDELVGIVRAELGRSDRPLPRIPYWLGLAGGYAVDGLARITGKNFAIRSERVRKFCASTQVATHELERLQFVAPFSLQEGLRRTIAGLDSREHAALEQVALAAS